MRVLFINLSIVLVLSAAVHAAEIKDKKPETEATKSADEKPIVELQSLDADLVDEDDELDDVKRKKKSTTTTFCVEIRPSGAEKSFQVCEPTTDTSKGAYGVPAPQPYYQNYGSGGQDQQKPHAAPYQSQTTAGGQTKPAAAFSNAVKTYAAPAAANGAANKPYTPHIQPYGGYRASEDDTDKELMGMTQDPEEEGDEDDVNEDPNMRAAYNGYSSSYGVPAVHTPLALPTRHHQHSVHHNNNGLVITCQPSLAGYAHPTAYHHAPVPSYNYRSAAPGGYGRTYDAYRPQPRPYGGYQHESGYKPEYQQKPVYKPAYQQPPQQYKSPAFPPQQYKPPAFSPQHAYKPQPAYQQEYKAPPQAYSHSNGYAQEYKTPAAYPPPAQAYPGAAEYKPQAYAGSSSAAAYKPQAYSPPAAEYKVPQYPASHPPAYAPAYAPPGTYREAENAVEAKTPAVKDGEKSEKETQTMHKMEEIAEQRAAGGPWRVEMASDGMKDAKNEEHMMAGGFRAAEEAKKEDHGLVGGYRNVEEMKKEEHAIAGGYRHPEEVKKDGHMMPGDGFGRAVDETMSISRENEVGEHNM